MNERTHPLVSFGTAPSTCSGALWRQHCAQRVPQYMIPELIEFRETLPKTSTGKLDRVQLAAGR